MIFFYFVISIINFNFTKFYKMIYLSWKPVGVTSINFIKKNFNFTKSTCSGKLDPLARGFIHILTDNDTKLMSYFMTLNKIYRFNLILGIETISHDPLSSILQLNDTSHLNIDNVLQDLHFFIRSYSVQTIPLVSSYIYKYNNIKKPLWWYYKNNYTNLSLPFKQVSIINYNIFKPKYIKLKTLSKNILFNLNKVQKYSPDINSDDFIIQWSNLKSLSPNLKFIVIPLELHVSSGFYIRQFCHDFGKFINSCAIANNITRIKII